MMRKIMIISSASFKPIKMYLDQTPKLAKGFILRGHDVRCFPYNSLMRQLSFVKSRTLSSFWYKKKADQILSIYIKHYMPDVILVSFVGFLDATTISQIREAAPKAVLIGIDGDPWPERQKNRIETAKELDILAATNDGEFLQTYRDACVQRCVFMPNMCDPDIDRRYEVSDKWRSDILWTGKGGHHAGPERTLRGALVNELAKRENCVLYGCCGRPKIAGIDYLHAICGARIGVNANACKPVRLYSSDRLTHYLACGAFVLAERMPDGDLLFEDGRHLRYFSTVDEFFELAEWYLAHEAERKKIADAGMKHVHEEFNSVKIAGYLLDLVEKGSYSAPWSCGVEASPET